MRYNTNTIQHSVQKYTTTFHATVTGMVSSLLSEVWQAVVSKDE